ncbi:MAG: hypothetical protein IPK60_16950 [Sandaracinaceae bacterium]|nr:hypothetical protein [Sandaracinaceae bacterium]
MDTPRGIVASRFVSIKPGQFQETILENAFETTIRTERLARFSVPFTAGTAGSARIEADVDFAVCTPENCMPDRRTVAVTLAVQ